MTKSILTRAMRNVVTPQQLYNKPSGNWMQSVFQTDKTAQMRQMEAVPTLFVIVDRLATSVSAVEWNLYRKAPRGKNREEVDKHPALTVLNKPNDFYSRGEFIYAASQHYDLTGEFWWVVARARGISVPLELWPVRPDFMEPVPGGKFLKGYVYKNGGEKIPLELDDVIFQRRQSPLDAYRGISPVGSLIFDLEGERAASRWNAMFFQNGAIPGGVVEIDEMVPDHEFEAMQRHWKSQHQGVHNAHRVAFLEKGKYKEIKYTNKDMDFVELRRLSKEQIRQAFGFPKPLLGDVDDVNRANAEAAEVLYTRWLINPRLDQFRQALNTRFLPMFKDGDKYEFDYNNPIPEDAEGQRAERDSQVANAIALINAGFEPVETLRVLDLPEIPFVGSSE